MRSAYDAIIVGAGPAGSTAAILLAQAGWSVALVEKQPFPRRKVCGECIAASNLPLFDALGIGAAFAAAAGPELRQVALMHGARTVLADLPAAGHARHPWGRALGRETLDSLLLERARAAGAVVLQPWSVQALDGTIGDHRCDVRALGPDGQFASVTLHAPVLIAAHGSWEPLPSGRESRCRGRGAADLFAFKANFRNTALAAGVLPVLAFGGGYGGMVVADQGVATLACCIRRDRLDAARHAAPGLRAGAVVEALLQRECRGVTQALAHAQRDGAWLASGPLAPGMRIAAGDTLFRVGNAAGEAHPIIGEGISMAMQSAWLLCARLVDARVAQRQVALRAVQAAYAADWRRHFAPRLRLAAAFAQLAMRPATSVPLLAFVGRWPAILTCGATWGGKVRCAADAATIERLAAAVAVAPTVAAHAASNLPAPTVRCPWAYPEEIP